MDHYTSNSHHVTVTGIKTMSTIKTEQVHTSTSLLMCALHCHNPGRHPKNHTIVEIEDVAVVFQLCTATSLQAVRMIAIELFP